MTIAIVISSSPPLHLRRSHRRCQHHHHHHHHNHHHRKVEKLKRKSHLFKPFQVRQTFQKDSEGNLINSSDADHRAASYLELFYDLIMAATFAKLGDALGEALAEPNEQGGETIYNILIFYFFSFYILQFSSLIFIFHFFVVAFCMFSIVVRIRATPFFFSYFHIPTSNSFSSLYF